MAQSFLVRRAALRLLVGASALALTACGRKGSPHPPLDVDPCYPRRYPMDEGAKAACAEKQRYMREHPPQPEQPRRGQRQTTPAPSAQPPSGQSAPATPPPSEAPASPEPPAQPQ